MKLRSLAIVLFLALLSGQARARIIKLGSSENLASATSVVVNVPTGTIDSSVSSPVLMTGVISCYASSAAQTHSITGGTWTQISTTTQQGTTGPAISQWYRYTASEPANYTFNATNCTGTIDGVIVTWEMAGVAAVDGSATSAASAASGTTSPAVAVTTSRPDLLLLSSVDNIANAVCPATWTSIWTSGTSGLTVCSSKFGNLVGATGDITLANASNPAWAVRLTALLQKRILIIGQ